MSSIEAGSTSIVDLRTDLATEAEALPTDDRFYVRPSLVCALRLVQIAVDFDVLSLEQGVFANGVIEYRFPPGLLLNDRMLTWCVQANVMVPSLAAFLLRNGSLEKIGSKTSPLAAFSLWQGLKEL